MSTLNMPAPTWVESRGEWIARADGRQFGSGRGGTAQDAARKRSQWLSAQEQQAPLLEPLEPPLREPPDDDYPAEPSGHRDGTSQPPVSAPDWWQSRPILARIHEYALSAMASPEAVLGVALMRALAIVPPSVVLPDVILGDGSLNMFCALVGRSGLGKGGADDVAEDALILPETVNTAPLGSGEGIVHCYAHREQRKDEETGKRVSEIVYDRHSVLFTADEIDAIAAISSRQGSTLLTQLRTAYSGGALGFSNADETRTIPLRKHTYRFCLVIGAQPEKAGPIIHDAAGGTPQRFIWLPVDSKEVTAVTPPKPDPWRVPAVSWGELPLNRAGRRVIRIPDEVADIIRRARALKMNPDTAASLDALDGHALFSQEKVAVGFAVLDGRAEVTMEDWRLAGHVMHLSDLTRGRILSTLEAQRQRHDDLEIDRHESAKDRADERRVERIADTLEKTLCESGNCEMRSIQLRRSLNSRYRDIYPDAIASLVRRRRVDVLGDIGDDGRGEARVRMADGT